MRRTKYRKEQIARISAAIVVLALSSAAFGLDLSALEAEADHIAVDQQSVHNVSMAQLELELKQKMPGTYLQFMDLSPQQREEIFEEYKQHQEVHRAAVKVIRFTRKATMGSGGNP